MERTRITIAADLRTFQRTTPGSILLTKFNQLWLRAPGTYTLGPVQTMCFDHNDHDAAEVLDIESDTPLFVLMREVKAVAV
jgi:hypothetical protein